MATTSSVNYTYGAGTQLKSVGACNEFYESYTYDQYRRPSAVDRFIQGRHYQSTYQYNSINQRTQSNDPAGTLSLQHDNLGRLSAIGSYLTNMAYNVAGQVSGFSLGNGVTESFGYDANRLQMTTDTATAPGGQTGGLMNLVYNYQASAGQMGSGSTAGNAGQLVSISNSTINGTTESAGYTYDNLGRLLTSNHTSNGSSAQRRLVYDRWGNRTSMWDAMSGGNQIQSIALEQSGSVPTNRIQSVITTGAVNYVYDAAGDVTNDGVHSYTYDAANRLVSVDSGATAEYLYDHQNRRVFKQAGSAKTDYIWDGSRVLEEHDGSASNPGTTLARYIYFASAMIAKIESGLTRYFLSDRLTTRLSLDASGSVLGRQAHLPYGENFGGSGTQEKHHFTSYEKDGESGLDYAVNRGYSSIVGRFIQSDPYRPSGYMIDPQSWNRYSYTRNEPVNLSDQLGLFISKVVILGPGCIAVRQTEEEYSYWEFFGSGCDGGGEGGGSDDGGGGGGGASCTLNAGEDISTAEEPPDSDSKWKVYDCQRPLNHPGSSEPCSGLVCHEYLCVQGKRGNIRCVGLNPPSSGQGPGENNPADVYHSENCREVSSDSCVAKCVRRKFGEPMPPYSWYGGGSAMNCHGWAGEVLSDCKGECKRQ